MLPIEELIGAKLSDRRVGFCDRIDHTSSPHYCTDWFKLCPLLRRSRFFVTESRIRLLIGAESEPLL